MRVHDAPSLEIPGAGADPVKVVLRRYTSGDELVSVHDNAPFPEILQTLCPAHYYDGW